MKLRRPSVSFLTRASVVLHRLPLTRPYGPGPGQPAVMNHASMYEHGLLLRRDAVASGLDDNWLARMVRAGALVRIRHGAYADA